MNIAQNSTTAPTSIDEIIDQARDDLRDLAAIAKTRKLTTAEFAEYEHLGRLINDQMLQRDTLLASA